MKTIGRTGVSPQEFRQTIEGLTAQHTAKQGEIKRLQAQAWDQLEASPPSALKDVFLDAVAKRVGVDRAFHSLLAEVSPVKLYELKRAYDEETRLASAVKSFEALAKSLRGVESAPDDAPIEAVYARQDFGARTQLLDDLKTVRTALAALGEGVKEAGLFPKKQLDRIEERARTDVNALVEARDQSLAGLPQGRVLSAKDLPTVASSADALGKILGQPELAAALTAAADRVKPAEKAEFASNLAALAVLADTARTAPDYSTTGASWSYPRSRMDYRARRFDSWDLFAAEGRRENTEARLGTLAKAVTNAAEPSAELAKSLVEGFLREIGVAPNTSKDWKVDAASVRKALQHEAFLPLRSLNENLGEMQQQRGAAAHADEIRQVVENVTQHVLQGDYREWRYESPKSAKQLSVLTAAQREDWKKGLELESPSAGGGKLKTREEDGVELLWVTKIGGPSHGFDYGPHCLLPLLANGRTKAILVDDDRWPHNAAARCYLRVLSREDGSPVLFLEPLQRDFPHRDAMKDKNEDTMFRLAQVQHALAKAKELGVPLTVSAYDDFALRELGVPFKRDDQKIVIEASAGVFEASDTMFQGHDFPQTKRMVSEPTGARVLVDPRNIGELA
ncbi:hypothetical protein L6R52_22255 [Myxococcota bacterium]|nr:hypothetical protein [Myxococcota bacterium]